MKGHKTSSMCNFQVQTTESKDHQDIPEEAINTEMCRHYQSISVLFQYKKNYRKVIGYTFYQEFFLIFLHSCNHGL